MDERRRKREREALAWGIESPQGDLATFADNVRSGRWVILHWLVAGRMIDLGARLGAPYVGGPEDAGDVSQLGIYFGQFSHDAERARLGCLIGYLRTKADWGEVLHPGLVVSEDYGLQDSVIIVEPVSDICRQRLGPVIEESEYLAKQEARLKRLKATRDKAWFGRNGHVFHKTCYYEAIKPIDSKWRSISITRESKTWPKGRACAICGGKTIRVKGTKRGR